MLGHGLGKAWRLSCSRVSHPLGYQEKEPSNCLLARTTALSPVVFIPFHEAFNSFLLFCFSRVIQERPACQDETEP